MTKNKLPENFSAFSVLSVDKKIDCSRDAMPASRRRSISPPTEKVKPALAHKNFARAIPSVKATTLKNFVPFRVVRG